VEAAEIEWYNNRIMRNIKLTIRYDGTNYAGWQSQKNATSIQDTIEAAIKKLTGRRSSVIASGRTDSGVHALAQVANFKTSSKIPFRNIEMALNAMLPDDMMISGCEEVNLKFNSQKSAKSKLYRYTIYNRDFMDPLLRHYAAKCFYHLDVGLMKKGARHLVGRHDFTSFQTKDGVERNAVRTVKYIKIEKTGYLIYIDIEANGFLYNMVRNIIGTLIEVGRGKCSADHVKEILAKKYKRTCGPTAPAKGLCLVQVRY
jgi:tRNA pseudouridine38-40 synthase